MTNPPARPRRPAGRSPALTAVLATVLAAALALSWAAPAAANATASTVGGPHMATHGVVVAAGTDPLPTVLAQSWVVADATTGAVLAAKYPHLRHRPASTLKTLTSITLMPRLDPATVHRVTAKEQARVYGSRAGIVVGGTYTVDDLWHALLLPSGNDAAAALAATYGGVRRTVAAMNAEAARLQARDTHAVNPSGLDADGQYTSAYDMALFARAAIAMPDFTRVSGTVSYDLPGRAAKPGKKRRTFKIYGQDRLLNDGYRGIIAGKTGYTTLAGRTFWVAAKRHGRTVIVTLMGIGEQTETAARALLDWGLANDPVAAPVGVLVDPLDTDTPAATGQPGAGTGGAVADRSGGAVLAAAAPGSEDATRSSTGALVLGLFLLAALVVVAVEVFWRRRRRGGSDAAPTVEAAPATPATPTTPPDPATPTTPPDPAGAAADSAAGPPRPPAVAPPPARPEEAGPGPAERARPAPVAPTGNVRVVRPPSRPD